MTATSEAPLAFRSTAARPGPLALLAEALRELWSRRRLIRYLVEADMKKKGADTLLGNVWWVADPLLQMLVYVVLVSLIFRQSVEDYPLFIFAAILPWKWFSSAISDAISSVSSRDRLIKQIQFPKVVLPASATVAGVVNFAFGLVALAGLLLVFYRDAISPALLWIPVIGIVQFVFTLAFSLVVAAVNVFYRDVGNISRHLLRLWFYLSPGLYGAAALVALRQSHPEVASLMTLNPFYVLFTAYRDVIYGAAAADGSRVVGAAPDLLALVVLFLVSLVLLALATIFFKRLEPSFAKVL